MPEINRHPASYRDPSGFIFQYNGKIYRQVNQVYAEHFDFLYSSGLYNELLEKKYLIQHSVITDETISSAAAYKIVLPEQIDFITYPYEWCFGQLKDAALLTLNILKAAAAFGMILKDATPYNVQFRGARPVLIDLLSFEKDDFTEPWVAYRQFCETFLYPLLLEHYVNLEVHRAFMAYPDGVPVDTISEMLPAKSRLSLGVWLNVLLPSNIKKNNKESSDKKQFSKKKLLQLIVHLEGTIRSLHPKNKKSQWSDYYDESITTKAYLDEKKNVFSTLTASLNVSSALDLGANDGKFSLLLAGKNIFVVSADSDSRSIGRLYDHLKKNDPGSILPLVMDLANPSPASGFSNLERNPFHERIKTDLVVALAIVHHLAITRNIPLSLIARYLSGFSRQLVIEWVPKEDEKVKVMLAGRKDVFEDYKQDEFERSFGTYFKTIRKMNIPGSVRVMYLMEILPEIM